MVQLGTSVVVYRRGSENTPVSIRQQYTFSWAATLEHGFLSSTCELKSHS